MKKYLAMNKDFNLASSRREYDKDDLNESDLPVDPFELFALWLNRAEETEKDPTAMVLSTVLNDQPNSRVVLLKGVENDEFVFFTNYHSKKGEELEINNKVALNFYWPDTERQVRIRGEALQLDPIDSDAYFNSRPKQSQVGALVSDQSSESKSREHLESSFEKTMEEHKDKDIARPPYWGGYTVKAFDIEFWQGRTSRLHDRFLYTLSNGAWKISRLDP